MIARKGLELQDGHYKLISRIAVGGMGEVWRAHDMLADAPVAVKVLRPEYTGDAVSLRRLRFEARNAAMLNHPNITRVLDYGEVGGTGYIVMEYVDGQSMADVLATHSTIGPLRLLPILIQSSLGLHAAHCAGVVHRDVKPGNILLGHADHVKLTDFGISVAHGQQPLTDTGKVMGTAQYLAPEQALGNPATPAGDLYSLGVIAYEALAGERPFRGVNYVAIALAQVNQPAPPLPTSVEASLAKLVMRLMEKDPEARPADGAELAGLFGAILETHRALAGRLLATRRGTAAPEPLRSGAPGPPDTQEQPAVSASLMPEAAPTTTASPQVEGDERPTEPALPAGAQPPVFPPAAPARPSPPPNRRRPAPFTEPPPVAVPSVMVPPVGAQPSMADAASTASPGPETAGRHRTEPGPTLAEPRRRDEFAVPTQARVAASTPAPSQPAPGGEAANQSLAGRGEAANHAHSSHADTAGAQAADRDAPEGGSPPAGAPGLAAGHGQAAGQGLAAEGSQAADQDSAADGAADHGSARNHAHSPHADSAGAQAADGAAPEGGGPPAGAPGLAAGHGQAAGQGLAAGDSREKDRGGAADHGSAANHAHPPHADAAGAQAADAAAPEGGRPPAGATPGGQSGGPQPIIVLTPGRDGGQTPAAASGPGAPDMGFAQPAGRRPPAFAPLPPGGQSGPGRPVPPRLGAGDGARRGQAASGKDLLETPRQDTGGAPRRPTRFPREWWAPLLVALGLIVILVIGLLTALNANGVGAGAPGPAGLFPSEPARTIMNVDNAPYAAPLRER